MHAPAPIRRLVEKALHIRRLTPEIENEINYELTRLGYISDVDYEALELLMSEMDAGRIKLVPNL
ncbi:hypothetical protein [Geitlerinema sp. PCC 7407]|jgi:hypothetical protein|uniref:hypothetical protein n=1 Tax=Geitlerinema sp. PCC 7407 TaxID=1173025 RepID=UPI00029FE1BC|nr:hypothetical protein [Geitlerinema sp. PCC 7407]AFY67314.1 hypothetical protein GEI7407_2843 [Geitlerinema sp. PCC 7407]